MPENVDPQIPPSREVGITRVTATEPRPGLYEFSIMDFVCLKKFECIALFFHYDIQVQALEAALRLLLDEYYECLSRIARHETQLYQMSVTEDAWIPLIEKETHMSATTALQQYARATAQADQMPAFMNVPFFLDGIFAESALDGNEPLFKVTLTHYANGECSVGFTIFNVIADLQRFYDMLTDLGSIMRGEIERVQPKSHDRTVFWPDYFLSHLGTQNHFIPTNFFPRVYQADCDVFHFDAKHFPNDTLSSETLFFPNDVLDGTLDRINSAVEDVTITRRQLVLSLIWLLECEMISTRETSVEEWSKHAPCWAVLDMCEGDNPCLTPSNYFGNAFLPSDNRYEQLTNAFEDDIYMHFLVNACLKINRSWTEGKDPEVVAKQCLGSYQVLSHVNMQKELPLYTVSISWHFESRQQNDCAFGKDPPFFMYVPTPGPVFHYSNSFFSDLYHNGYFAEVIVVGRNRTRFLNSQVLQRCVPGTRHIFGHDGDPFL